MTSIDLRILWLLRVWPRPLSDLALEKLSKDTPGGTVRAARKRLQDEGLIALAGWSGRGRRKRRTWKLA